MSLVEVVAIVCYVTSKTSSKYQEAEISSNGEVNRVSDGVLDTYFSSVGLEGRVVKRTRCALPHLELLSKMNCDDIIDNFTVEEIEVSIRKLKSNKAGGIDGLQSEHLKFGGTLLTLWLTQIFSAFIQFEQVPPSLL